MMIVIQGRGPPKKADEGGQDSKDPWQKRDPDLGFT